VIAALGAPSLALTNASVLALQRTAGNQAVIRALRPTLSRLVAGPTADLFDYDELATQIHEAVDGPGTDEQAIFHVLERLQRNPAAIARLRAAYVRYGDLDADLRDDLSGSELNYALQLINAGGAGGTETIGAAPSSSADFDNAAQRIRAAVEGLGTDEEAIYAVLQPLGRNSGMAAVLKERYLGLYGEDMRARLVDELTDEEFQHAAYLLGEAALEQTDVSPAQAQRIYTVMAGLTFTNARSEQVGVPYHYPVDGCYARAQMMSQVLTAAGFANERVFATSTRPGGLSIPNQFSEDQPGGRPAETRWFYHVAPIINLRGPNGVEQVVIDPSTQPGPVTVDVWLSAMGTPAGGYQRMTHAQLMQHLADARTAGGPMVNGFPVNEQLAWTTDRNTMYPGQGPTADSRYADAELASLNPRMTSYADAAATHEVAASVRAELARPGATATSVVAAIRAHPPLPRASLWLRFPQLRAEAGARFPGQEAALDAAVGP
jgi:hypothetical protein